MSGKYYSLDGNWYNTVKEAEESNRNYWFKLKRTEKTISSLKSLDILKLRNYDKEEHKKLEILVENITMIILEGNMDFKLFEMMYRISLFLYDINLESPNYYDLIINLLISSAKLGVDYSKKENEYLEYFQKLKAQLKTDLMSDNTELIKTR